MRPRAAITIMLMLLSAMTGRAQTYTLDSCLAMALENDVRIKNARIDIQMADEDKRYAFTKYFPTVTAGAGGFISADQLIKTDVPILSLDGSIVLPFSDNVVSASLDIMYQLNLIKQGAIGTVSAMQPIFAGGQIVNGNRLAALQQEVRRLQYEMTRDQVMQSVREYYWQMVSVYSNISTLDTATVLLDSLHSTVSRYVNAGVATASDLIAVELKQKEIVSQRLKVENGMELLRMVLAQLAGADIDSFKVYIPDTISIEDNPLKWYVQPSQAAAGRKELELAGMDVRAQELQVKTERGKLLPSVGVGAIAFRKDIDLQGGFEHDRCNNIMGLVTVSVPITEAWGGSHKVRKARLSQLKAQNVYDDALEQLQLDIRQSWNTLIESWSQIDIAQKSLDSARENLRVTENLYNAGMETTTVMLEALTTFIQSQSNLQQAKASYLSNLSSYRIKTAQQ